MRLTDIHCSGCGSTQVVALDPGEEPIRSGMPLFDVLLDAGRPSTGLCLRCLTARFPALNRVEAAQA